MAIDQATRKQLKTKTLDENTFCEKMNKKGYFCEKCSLSQDKKGMDFKFRFPNSTKDEYVDVKGFKSFKRIFGIDKEHVYIETFYDINSEPKTPGWVCHDWYTAFKVTDEYDYALVNNQSLRDLLKEKAIKNVKGIELDSVVDEYEIKTYYPYIRNSNDRNGARKIKSVLYWVPIKDITSLKDVVFI